MKGEKTMRFTGLLKSVSEARRMVVVRQKGYYSVLKGSVRLKGYYSVCIALKL